MADQVLNVKGKKIKEVSLYYNDDIIYDDFQFFDDKGKIKYDGGIEKNELSISIEEIYIKVDAATGKVLYWPKNYERSVELNALVENKATYTITFEDGTSIEIWNNGNVPEFFTIEEYSTDHINFIIDKEGNIKKWIENECPKLIAETYLNMLENDDKPIMRKDSDDESDDSNQGKSPVIESDDED